MLLRPRFGRADGQATDGVLDQVDATPKVPLHLHRAVGENDPFAALPGKKGQLVALLL
jgi:hypothetical protein